MNCVFGSAKVHKKNFPSPTHESVMESFLETFISDQ